VFTVGATFKNPAQCLLGPAVLEAYASLRRWRCVRRWHALCLSRVLSSATWSLTLAASVDAHVELD
jgi:hypothetical protein